MNEKYVTKTDLIKLIALKQPHLSYKDVELSVKSMLDQMVDSLSVGGRVEARGFGSFSLHHRTSRRGRNPKTGEQVELGSKYVPHFKPGKELRDRANNQN